MQGLGSTYLTLTTFGTTVVGVIIIVAGIIGISLAQTMKGKFIWGIIGTIGIATIWLSTKTRTHIKQNESSSDQYGLVLLGLMIFGGLTSAIGKMMNPEPMPIRGGFEPQITTVDNSDNNSTQDVQNGSGEGGSSDESN
jgi:hypothetical protein